MKSEYSKYTIPELQEALAIVDGNAYPENKAALEEELQTRKESGEYSRFVQEGREAQKRELIHGVNFAKKVRKVIATYLVIAALYGFLDSTTKRNRWVDAEQ